MQMPRFNEDEIQPVTLNTLIQVGHSNLRTVNVPIRDNGETRLSRQFGRIRNYVGRSMIDSILLFILGCLTSAPVEQISGIA